MSNKMQKLHNFFLCVWVGEGGIYLFCFYICLTFFEKKKPTSWTIPSFFQLQNFEAGSLDVCLKEIWERELTRDRPTQGYIQNPGALPSFSIPLERFRLVQIGKTWERSTVSFSKSRRAVLDIALRRWAPYGIRFSKQITLALSSALRFKRKPNVACS